MAKWWKFEPRDPFSGKWIRGVPSLHTADLSTPDARRSPTVTESEYQAHALRGVKKLAARASGSTPPSALEGDSWSRLVDNAFNASRKPWGGVTVDTHTGQHVPDDADAYALTIRSPHDEAEKVSPTASREEFGKAMDRAKARFGDRLAMTGGHLGVFHDEDTNTIDIDPVLVTSSLEDVHDIGAYTRAKGGAYHFKSGNGYWPPHVAQKKAKDMSRTILTPQAADGTIDLTVKDGKLAFWKMILPKRAVHYTGKDGKRHVANFDDAYLTDLARNKAVDSLPFVLADAENRHTMDPERQRGTVTELAVRDDGLYGKIVFPNAEAASAVLNNPDLGVSARIREGIRKSDGTMLNRGLIHVLGTMDPQADGMGPWQQTDLANEGDVVLDLSTEEYDMTRKNATRERKPLDEVTEEDVAAMTEEELDTFLAEFAASFADYDGDDEEEPADEADEHSESEDTKVPALAGAGADMSNTDTEQTEELRLANEFAASANARATEALRRLAEEQWQHARDGYLSAGVPPHALDLAAPVLNRPDDMVIDLSNEDSDDVNASEVVRGLLDALKGTVDLSTEEGHASTFDPGNEEDPDKAFLDLWDEQF